MAPITFTDKDLLRDKIVEPGWYNVHVEDTDETPSKDGGSTNYNMHGVILGSMDGDPTYAGVPLKWQFNSKAISFSIGFLQALGIEVKPGERYDLTGFAKGKTVCLYIKTGSYNDRPKNEVTHAYRPATTS